MPIYEWNCAACALSFEALASIAEADTARACPECGESAGRIISACTIGASGASGATAETTMSHVAGSSQHHANRHGRRSPIPAPARLCWMDDKSAERFAAYKTGRGHEYDDRQAALTERRQRRGEAAPEPAANSYSPVAQILARKKAQAALKEAAVKAATKPTEDVQSAAASPAAGTSPRGQ